MSVHQNFFESLAQFNDKSLTLPPPSMLELQLEYMEVIPGVKMVAKLPFQKRFTNPVGIFQGGFLSAGIDDVFGPLSYVTSNGACMTLSLNVTFLGAFTDKMPFCLIEAVVLKKTKNFIFLRADVRSHDGEHLAHAESHMKVL